MPPTLELHIDEIQIPEPLNESYFAAPVFNSLTGIRRLNIFIGPNNTGKSRLLRSLFLLGTTCRVGTSDIRLQNIRTTIRSALSVLDKQAASLNMSPSEQRHFLRSMKLGFLPLMNAVSQDPEIRSQLTTLREHFATVFTYRCTQSNEPVVRDALSSVYSMSSSIPSTEGNLIDTHNDTFINASFVYIPSLRGLRPPLHPSLGVTPPQSASDLYYERTKLDYFASENIARGTSISPLDHLATGTHMIFTGQSFYSSVQECLLGDLPNRDRIRKYQDYLSEAFFDRQSIAIIPRLRSDTVFLKIGSEKERPIQDLGDGLQQLVILTWPMFLIDDRPLFLFVEEPELFLHAGYQRQFIEAVMTRPNRQLYVFATSHSTQFIDLTLNDFSCAAFRVSKQLTASDDLQTNDERTPSFEVTTLASGDRSMLADLGVRPSSLMLVNCTIWVEGITDRLYFARYLDIYTRHRMETFCSANGHDRPRSVREFKQGIHFAFVEFGGSTIVHWDFLEEGEQAGESDAERMIDVNRLTSTWFVVVDRDDSRSDGKDTVSKRNQKLERILRGRFVCLKVRSVENLLSQQVLERIVESYLEVDCTGIAPADYSNRPMGRVMDEIVGKVAAENPGLTKSKTFTKSLGNEERSEGLNDKLEFATRALDQLKSWDDLSDEAKEIAEQLYIFVATANGVALPEDFAVTKEPSNKSDVDSQTAE